MLAAPVAAMRAYAIVHEPTPLYFERVTTLLGMLEHPAALVAPVGSRLMTDSDDGRRGVICAERELRGWVLR